MFQVELLQSPPKHAVGTLRNVSANFETSASTLGAISLFLISAFAALSLLAHIATTVALNDSGTCLPSATMLRIASFRSFSVPPLIMRDVTATKSSHVRQRSSVELVFFGFLLLVVLSHDTIAH